MENILSLRLQTLPPIRRTAWVLSLMAASFAWAGPGAHGPNGGHLGTAAAPRATQPGASMRDQEVIDAANERGVAMVFTGVRHFRH